MEGERPDTAAAPAASSAAIAAPTQSPQPSLTSAAGAAETVGEDLDVGICQAAILNVRTGPDTSYARAGYLYRGASMYILEEKGNWLRIQSGATAGWCECAVCRFGGAAVKNGGPSFIANGGAFKKMTGEANLYAAYQQANQYRRCACKGRAGYYTRVTRTFVVSTARTVRRRPAGSSRVQQAHGGG
jgi:hypothetical protein